MKKYLLSIFVGSSFLFSAQITNGLLVHYELNGDANDATSNQLHGTVQGATNTADASGNSNSALSFDGVNDYVELPNSAIMKPQFPLTLAFWLKVDQSEDCSVYFSDFLDYQYSGFWVNVSASNKISISFGDGGAAGSSSRQSKTSSPSIQIGTWQHFVFTIRGANDMDIFMDCEEVNGFYSGDGGSGMVYGTDGPRLMTSIAIGQFDHVFLKGSMDDIMLWDRELTPSEIASFCQVNAVEENKLGDVILYPNPVNHVLKIKSNDVHISKVSVFNSEGKLMIEKTHGFESINTEALTSGVYFVKIQDENSANTYKIVKD
ncbi:MAG: type sorting protein [Crocinitomicaceae bacterium]|jgi:hypothetical protein|nr:type sorting protein [Crocinitomicaceae bacterium]